MRLFVNAITLLIVAQFSIQQELEDEQSFEKLEKCFPENLLPLLDVNNALELYKSQQQFTLALVKDIYNSNPGKNIFFSPYSIYQALLLSLFISSNHTEYNIKRALQLPTDITKAKVIQAFKLESGFQKMRSINSSSSYEFNNANRFFMNQQVSIRDCMKELFEDEIYPVDYSNADNALELINQWVSRQTKNQINNLLSKGDVTEDTKLVLANAAYFKGLWQSKFYPENTKKEVFFITPSKNALVMMMRQKGNFKYFASDKLGAHVLQLPYKGNDISMFILLPPFVSPNGTEYMLNKLTPSILAEIVEPGYMVDRTVEISIPKFTVEQEIKLVPVLESLGVGDLFQQTSDLSGITGKPDIKFNNAIHKAKVSIDEDGTIAAASTAFYSFRSSRPLEPIKFICNHPFLYFIFDNISQSVLFIGVYNSPL